MIVSLCFVVMTCGVVAEGGLVIDRVNSSTTTTQNDVWIGELRLRPPTGFPTIEELRSEFIQKLEYHFNASNKALANLETSIAKGLQENAAMKSQISDFESKIEAQLAEGEKGHVAKLDEVEKGLVAKLDEVEKGHVAKLDEVEKGLDAKLDEVEKGHVAKLDEVEKGLVAKLGEVEKGLVVKLDEVQADLKKERINGCENHTESTKPVACTDGKKLKDVCYKILKCDPYGCDASTAKAMCTKINATLAPLRTEEILKFVHEYQKELDIWYLLIDGSDAAKEGDWVYSDGSKMYTKWGPG